MRFRFVEMPTIIYIRTRMLFLLALVPCFLLFVFLFFSCFFLYPGMLTFLVFLRLCSSHLLLSASTYFIVRVFSACVICILPHLGIIMFFIRLLFFRSSYFSGGVFFLLCSLTRCASTRFAYCTLISDVSICLP